MELCRFYRLNRRCYKQDRCPFMHGEFPCKFHHTGNRCYWGDKCRYSHAEIDVNLKKLLLKVKLIVLTTNEIREKKDFFLYSTWNILYSKPHPTVLTNLDRQMNNLDPIKSTLTTLYSHFVTLITIRFS